MLAKRGVDSYPYRHCEICGEKIRKKEREGAKRYGELKICRMADSPDCFNKFMVKGNKSRAPRINKIRKEKKAPEYLTKGLFKVEKPRQPKISQREAERLDAAQRELDRKAMEKHLYDYTTLPAVSLDEHTRRELEKVYQPPMVKNYDIMPHFHRRARGII